MLTGSNGRCKVAALTKQRREIMNKLPQGYFVDVGGRIHQVAHWFRDGCSANYRVHIVGDTVYEVTAVEDEGLLLGNEYTLWPSLTELAKAIEG